MNLTFIPAFIIAQSSYAIGQIVGGLFMLALVGAIIWSVINKKK